MSRLLPLYAIGVFTSFTLSQAGMTKHHFRLKEVGALINGIGALLSALVLGIVAYVKFPEGAWVIIVLVPIMVIGLVRMNRAYEAEDHELKEDDKAAAQVPTLRRHSVVVFVDHLDAATARAIQYARTFFPDDLRAVHFDVDPWKTDMPIEAWRELGFSRFPLDIIECPDRRVPRAALEFAAQLAGDGQTEVTILIPRREYTKFWHRLLHDRSSSSIAAAVANVAHCNVTHVPYHLREGLVTVAGTSPLASASTNGNGNAKAVVGPAATHLPTGGLPAGRTLINVVESRQQAFVAGRVRGLRVQPWGGAPSRQRPRHGGHPSRPARHHQPDLRHHHGPRPARQPRRPPLRSTGSAACTRPPAAIRLPRRHLICGQVRGTHTRLRIG